MWRSDVTRGELSVTPFSKILRKESLGATGTTFGTNTRDRPIVAHSALLSLQSLFIYFTWGTVGKYSVLTVEE